MFCVLNICISKVSVMSHNQHLHHSNIANPKTNRSFTTATRDNQTQAGASPQQHCKTKSKQKLYHKNLEQTSSKQEHHHSNIGNRKASRSITTATRDIEKRAGASPQQHCKTTSKHELHHSNIGKQQASRSITTATRDIEKLAGASLQQY